MDAQPIDCEWDCRGQYYSPSGSRANPDLWNESGLTILESGDFMTLGAYLTWLANLLKPEYKMGVAVSSVVLMLLIRPQGLFKGTI